MSTSQGSPGSVLERDVGRPASISGRGHVSATDTSTLITDLPYGPEAAQVAREAVAVALHGTQSELLDDARLITSELATNAFASGNPPLVLCVDRTTPTTGGLEVEITVTDGGCPHPTPSSPSAPEEWAESGRGLVIVEALADTWSLAPGTHGTRAWCRLTRAAHPSASSN
ncbi:ATP-binding protein [Streptomyces cucumeris]|uniref:ATP-binding protein n=1 Tax=Streptomyces cucumeris TaxID=2962890 RepID=UPI003D733C45